MFSLTSSGEHERLKIGPFLLSPLLGPQAGESLKRERLAVIVKTS